VDSVCTRNDNVSQTNPPMPAGCKGTGGWIQINGHVIRVPQNTILQMPANTLRGKRCSNTTHSVPATRPDWRF
jgi:hypothetical protein